MGQAGSGSGAKAFRSAVDAFVAARKTIVFGNASPEWREARDVYGYRLKLPVEIAGEQHPGQFLVIDAYPDRKPHEFFVMLLFADHTVCRLDFEPTAVHPNPMNSPVPSVVHGPHWHSWSLNRDHVKIVSGKHFDLPVAAPISGPRNFDDALRFYCQENNIELGAHPIEFPYPGQLFPP